MKKCLSLLMALILTMSVCAFAGAEEYQVKYAAPAGAPALALAAILAETDEGNYQLLAADTIGTAFAADSGFDFVIAPINAGAKLFKAGKSTYRLAAVITWGNLYIASQKENFQLADVNGGVITLFGENTITASVVLYSLEKAGIVPAQVEYLAGAQDTQKLLGDDAEAIVVTAEPALTGAKMQKPEITAYSVQDLLKEAAGMDGYTQAGLFVREETIQANPEVVAATLALIQASAGLAETDVATMAAAAEQVGILPKAKVAELAIPGCSIRYVPAQEAKEALEQTANIDLSQFGGEVPADDFYYDAE